MTPKQIASIVRLTLTITEAKAAIPGPLDPQADELSHSRGLMLSRMVRALKSGDVDRVFDLLADGNARGLCAPAWTVEAEDTIALIRSGGE